MVGTTLGTVVQRAIEVIGQVAGTGVQVYAEDQMLRDAIRGFNLVLKKYNWPHYCTWRTFTLDGVTGKDVGAGQFTDVRDIDDLISVHRANEDTPLAILSPDTNPNRLSGTAIYFWNFLPVSDADFAAKRIQVWPKTATGSLDVNVKVYPTGTLDEDTTVYLDEDMLVYGVAMVSLMGDGLNGPAAKTCQDLMEMRFNDIMNNLGKHPIAVRGGGPGIPNTWS